MSSRKLLASILMVCLAAAGVGAATSYLRDPSKVTRSGGAISPSLSDGEMLARLKDYTRSIGTQESGSAATAGELLPDVDTMIERLTARLETTPEDLKGWRMLGWSYFHTGYYEQAATAYARALELDPNSPEVKLSYEEAKSRAAEPAVKRIEKTEATPTHKRDAAIRSMVDGLTDRLKSSPRDVEGWTHLMRSRVVLGEREVAAAAFRKALEVFKDDQAASGRITAAAIELGLKAE
jgi:tetratricopeptide (TPR) repeat protein